MCSQAKTEVVSHGPTSAAESCHLGSHAGQLVKAGLHRQQNAVEVRHHEMHDVLECIVLGRVRRLRYTIGLIQILRLISVRIGASVAAVFGRRFEPLDARHGVPRGYGCGIQKNTSRVVTILVALIGKKKWQWTGVSQTTGLEIVPTGRL